MLNKSKAVSLATATHFLGQNLIRWKKGIEFFFISPGHNQIWIYDDVTHICKMAATPRNTREGHFLACLLYTSDAADE